MSRSFVVAVALAAVACAACSSATSTGAAGTGAAGNAGGAGRTGRATTTVSTGASVPKLVERRTARLTIRWTPDMNWKHGKTVVTRGDAAQGRRLLHDIRVAKKVPKNAHYPCPADLGANANFRYAGKHGTAQLTSCHWVNYRHRSYWIDNAITKDLRALAPHRWLVFLTITPKPRLSIAWTPNVNWKHGRTEVRHGSAAQGRQLLRDVRTAHVVKHPGNFFCPIDFGVSAKFWFNGKHGRADLGGCHFITLGHKTYRPDKAVTKDLRALAPKRWKQYLR